MARRWNGRVSDCVVVDLNTQWDYCALEGADPVANIDTLIPALRQIVAWAKWYGTPVISSIESHRLDELPKEVHSTCCRDGSPGQRKVEFTIFPHNSCVEVDNTLCCPLDLFKRYQQVIFRKRTNDLLGNPKADRFLNQLPVGDFILVGVGLESAIKALALTLLARGKRAVVVADACGYWNRSAADLALRQVGAKGAKLITVSELLGRKPDRTRMGCYGRRRRAVLDAATKRSGSDRSDKPLKHRPTDSGLIQIPADLQKKRIGSRRLPDRKP